MAKLKTFSPTLPLLALLLLVLQTQGDARATGARAAGVYVPAGGTELRPAPVAFPAAAAAPYEPFRLCLDCRCCAAGQQGGCVATSCCYAINCNLPGKPFGVCAFTPQTCDCTNCTQSGGGN